ncbi:hypothetical protein [Flavobacterium sp. NKUCC04_CG]|uniref:hypothetical protein n=1 Tax=Flavobacterium sp. NKUCC04_CG TaxID=2842121 RepID=UPI001C5AEDBF|nr:hypothetical protein [Flavobacterium sp. NKUCC04_CG]MBW3519637.1 hypothetical protein [Flavobacterium sp. NKUCC04_CG]
MSKITVIITRHTIEKQSDLFQKSISIADEVILIDTFNSEDSKENLVPSVDWVLKCTPEQEEQTKLKATQQASNEWILFLNHNEVITPELHKELFSILADSRGFGEFYTRKKGLFFMGKIVRFGGYTSRKSLLLQRHPQYAKSDLGIAFLKNTTLDYSYTTFDQYNKKLDQHSLRLSEAMYSRNIRPNFLHFTLRPLNEFVYRYFVQIGFLDAKEGFILAYLQAFATYKKYLFLWMKYRKIEF